MRPRLILPILLVSAVIASSAYILVNQEPEEVACQKKCDGKKIPVPAKAAGDADLLNTSFNHLTASM